MIPLLPDLVAQQGQRAQAHVASASAQALADARAQLAREKAEYARRTTALRKQLQVAAADELKAAKTLTEARL